MSSQSPEDVTPPCPRCGGRTEPFQEYCLECGARLPGTYAYGREVPGGGSNPNWLWAALVGLLLVALVAGAIVAIAATGGGDEGGAGSGTAGTGTGALPADTGVVVPPAATGGGEVVEPGATPQPAPPPPAPQQTVPISWPADTNGYTIVLASTPASAGRGGATPVARKAMNAGVPEVGILRSADFASLNPGYYVVFSGVYKTRAQAEAGLGQARSSGFPLAYAREVSS